jgi:aryl-alcohol dehydrogenase-like predicted oxidoreductase
MAMIDGHATPQGTERFRERFSSLNPEHFRRAAGVPGAGELWFSSVGLGTYLGEPDEAADQRYVEAISTAARHGINVLDTAINYRHQRSERNIGTALRRLIDEGDLQRDEVVVCSKAGYLSFDGGVPQDAKEYFVREYVEKGVLKPSEVAGGMHCMAPQYLSNQIDRSRQNLGLSTIDIYYVHNPESQLGDVSHEEFRTRLRAAFGLLEKAVKEGRIKFYGVATWSAFRVGPGEQAYVSLPECVDLAEDAGGEQHHFRFVQMPFNLAMPEGYVMKNQQFGKEMMSTLEFASQAGIAVVGSASLYQGQLTRNLPAFVVEKIGMRNDGERALQFARSAPGILSSLVGMGKPAHVLENLATAANPRMTKEQWEGLFTKAAG